MRIKIYKYKSYSFSTNENIKIFLRQNNLFYKIKNNSHLAVLLSVPLVSSEEPSPVPVNARQQWVYGVSVLGQKNCGFLLVFLVSHMFGFLSIGPVLCFLLLFLETPGCKTSRFIFNAILQNVILPIKANIYK